MGIHISKEHATLHRKGRTGNRVATELMGDKNDTEECSNFRFSLRWLLRIRSFGFFCGGRDNFEKYITSILRVKATQDTS
jgi:hypothetical protein